MERAYCTYFDSNYALQGLALIRSMLEWCQPMELWVLALDQIVFKFLRGSASSLVNVVSLEDFESPTLRAVRGTRPWREYIWTCTPSWIAEVLDRTEAPAVSYIDADCFLFGRPDPMFDEIGNAEIAITPHRFSPRYLHYAKTSGKFNVGLVYMRREGAARPCLLHWHEQCLESCELDHTRRLCGDQIYLDHWPNTWRAHVIAHKGANLAPWNQRNQYDYSFRDGQIFVDEDPLIWYHFHGGIHPNYSLDPFVKDHIYSAYVEVLEEIEVGGFP